MAHAIWLGNPDRPLMGWVSHPPAPSGDGVLIVPPIGYDYWTSQSALRHLADCLASAGAIALRIDYDGTGDSAGDQCDPDRMSHWAQSVRSGVAKLREMGARQVHVVGLRLGATLALLVGDGLDIDSIVAWAPIADGRRYARELRLLGYRIPDANGNAATSGSIVVAGSVFTGQTLADLSALSSRSLAARPARRVLLVGGLEGHQVEKFEPVLSELGSEVRVERNAGTELCLGLPAEYAQVPVELIGRIVTWLSADWRPSTSVTERSDGRSAVTFDSAGERITETVISLGDGELVGVLGEHSQQHVSDAGTVVWVNSGSESHVGPGRAWVEYSRALNAHGVRTVRLDCRGWGESPSGDFGLGRPYDPHMAADLRDAVRWLTGHSYGPVTLAGLCAGAWMSIKVAAEGGADRVVAINPQLYWRPGDPVEANILTETHVRRRSERSRIKRLGRFRLWTALDRVHVRHPASRWLRELRARSIPTLILFAEGDDGLEFVRDRLSRAWGEFVSGDSAHVLEIAQIDHGMQRHWLRPQVIEPVLRFVLEPTSGASRDPIRDAPEPPA